MEKNTKEAGARPGLGVKIAIYVMPPIICLGKDKPNSTKHSSEARNA